jgi:ectoine hydroxylase-related dioxygenase (phytanoyl-CoA dioxygenase family)
MTRRRPRYCQRRQRDDQLGKSAACGAAISAMWCVTAFTPDNGPLRVPGSHRVSELPIDMLAFRSGMDSHPDEVKIVAPARSVILFNSAGLWHSGTQLQPCPGLTVTAGFSPRSPPR